VWGWAHMCSTWWHDVLNPMQRCMLRDGQILPPEWCTYELCWLLMLCMLTAAGAARLQGGPLPVVCLLVP
jgi:fumarate reductase subunit C